MSTGLHQPGLVPSTHRGRIKLLRGFVSKSSAVLNPLIVTLLACELRGRLLRGPAHQLAVRMRIIIISNNNNYGTWPGYGTVRSILPIGNFSLLLRCICYAEGFAL